MNVIEVKNVSKQFGALKALDDVNLTLTEGKIIGLLGKNGAGKSTLLRTILGYLKFEGEINVFDVPVKGNRLAVAKRVAFIPDVSSLDNRLTVAQTMEYVSKMHPMWNEMFAQRLIKKSELPLDKKVGQLSKGMKTKLYLLVTLALDVDILILDEPTIGLDISFRKEFFNTILGDFFNESKTILISTHQIEEVEHILDEIIFIDKGRIALHENIDKLKSDYKVITVNPDQEPELDHYKPKMKTKMLGKISAVVNSQVEIENAEYSKPMLADVFLAVVGGHNEN
ncbi:MAG: ABC transporter ATP-binding protein [Candidatus Cloacimonadota bacterium]|nr:ABC transporter ATP-binding protein [Candidatus Cloacimonadota bacterium]